MPVDPEYYSQHYERTLKNHFHKNFGINLFLEKYQAYITKIDNDANNKGRYDNFLNDLGIREKYRALPWRISKS